jgi:glycosyltransferase involved in cell wall biosynthesis
MAKISKILFIITQSEWGGAGRYVFDLANNLPKDQFEVMVAAGGNEELFEFLGQIKIKTFHLKRLVREINPIKDLAGYWEMKRLIKNLKPDIVHLNSSKAGFLGALAAHSAGVKKIIYTVHGFVFNEPMASWQKAIYLWAEKFSAKYKDKLICVSEFDRQAGSQNKIATADKLITIHHGINQINFLTKAQARQELKLPAENLIVGTIANFYQTKGLNYLIAGAAEIIKQDQNILFRVIGFGRLENQLKAEIKKFKLENNFFLGKVLNGKKYLLAFDLFVLPSVKEGLSYTILEAMQAGLPIVATKVGGIPEMIKNQHNGLLVNPANPKELAQAITSLLKDKSLAQKFGNQAQIDFRQNFSLEKMIKETISTYQTN